MKNKLKLIFLPFLLIDVSFICLYTFFNWFLFIKWDLFSINESIRNFGLPMFLLWISILIWLKPRINLFEHQESKRSNLKSTYVIVAWLLMACPAIIAQEYMTTATGKLTDLTSINDIRNQEKTKFYTVKDYFVFKKGAKFHPTTKVTGRYNEHLRWNLYIVFPIYETRRQRINPPPAWLGIKYTKEINNRLSNEKKEKKLKEFLESSEKDFFANDVQKFIYLNRLDSSDHLNGYLEAIKGISEFNIESAIVLVPVNESYSKRNGSKPFWLCVSFFIGTFVWLLMLWKPKLNKEKLNCFLENPFSEDNELQKYFTFFIPRKQYLITPILLNLNSFIFLIMFFSGAGFMSLEITALLNWGANYTPYISEGEYWRLVASTFLHGGIIHLVCNMYGLIFVGKCLEPALGKSKFILVYLLTGVVASLASVYWQRDVVSVGASGAILGLYGIFLAILLPKALPSDIRGTLLGITTLFILSTLIVGFISTGIDNAAHIGGLVSGLILGLLIDRDKKTALNLLSVVKLEVDSCS